LHIFCKLYSYKCDVLHQGQLSTALIEFCGEKIHPETSICNLHVIVDSAMTFKQHGHQLLLPAEADEELTETAAF